VASAQCLDRNAPTATYTVTFVSEWSQANHPAGFPGNPHFSPLIGGTHSGGVSFWEPGGLATPGIKRMAETGSPTILRGEVQSAVDAGGAGSVLQGGGIALSPGQVGFEFEISEDFPLLTLVTMIAPSPDWFVGVHGLSLRDGDGWLPGLEVDLWAYDAGTDSGAAYTSPNQSTSPPEPIRNISDEQPFVGTGRIGTLVFEQAASGQYPDIAPPCGQLNFFDVSAFVTAFSNGDPSADVAAPFGQLNFFDVSAFITAFSNGIP
jgi:hypothetical protein